MFSHLGRVAPTQHEIRGRKVMDLHLAKGIDSNVGITAINHPFGNGLYQLSMVIWGMVYFCYTYTIDLTSDNIDSIDMTSSSSERPWCGINDGT